MFFCLTGLILKYTCKDILGFYTCMGIDTVIEGVKSRLPSGFPDDITKPIFDGIRKAAGKF